MKTVLLTTCRVITISPPRNWRAQPRQLSFPGRKKSWLAS